jgi:hypothetical protein
MTAFQTALKNLTIDDLENWKTVKTALSDRKQELEKEKKDNAKKQKDDVDNKEKKLKRALTILQKKLNKDTKSATKKSLKITGNQLVTNFKFTQPPNGQDTFALLTNMCKSIHNTHLKPDAKLLEPAGAKNRHFQNFSKYWGSIGVMAISKEDLKLVGGKRIWNKTEWAKLTQDEKRSPTSPWNVVVEAVRSK